jgi:hypothetical protein
VLLYDALNQSETKPGAAASAREKRLEQVRQMVWLEAFPTIFNTRFQPPGSVLAYLPRTQDNCALLG